jgi:hypothetical protein
MWSAQRGVTFLLADLVCIGVSLYDSESGRQSKALVPSPSTRLRTTKRIEGGKHVYRSFVGV